jgi:hypothetical protein
VADWELLILAEGRRSWLAYERLRSSRKPAVRDLPDTTKVSSFAAAARQIAGKPAPTPFGRSRIAV